MCGIAGYSLSSDSRIGRTLAAQALLAGIAERGADAAGYAFRDDGGAVTVVKRRAGASALLDDLQIPDAATQALVHVRDYTKGHPSIEANNHPIRHGAVVGIHNGIIVNDEEILARHAIERAEPDMTVDSEAIFALIRAELKRGGNLIEATRATFAKLEGAASIATMFDDRDQLLLATNNGSLYYRHAPASGLFVFASERWIMDQFAAKYPSLASCETVHVKAGQGVVVNMHDLALASFDLKATGTPVETPPRGAPRAFIDRAVVDEREVPPLPKLDLERLHAKFPYVSMKDRLRRCTRCVLPETMPYIDFDEQGVCAYCRRHRPAPPHGLDKLEALVAPHRRTDGRPDCVVGLSGGRDSTYGLHYIKTVLGLNPVAYTYDWGMVTPIARRNISRICGKLGIEHLWVSADIPQKREWIRKNVEAWLHRPTLGTIPLFMAGDKAYFHYLNKAKQQLGVTLGFLCENPLERTDFKTGFAGVAPMKLDDDHAYTMPMKNRAKLAAYYAKEFIRNPRYLNTSLFDSAMGFAYYYVIKRDYENLYRYIQWDEQTIERTLIDEYGFELAEDTATTWRIGDGTASFYNYIYYSIAGMTENDTFRSNQIRIGAIERERALELIDRDSRPRFPSIDWYLRTIGIDRSLEDVLETIERAPKLWR